LWNPVGTGILKGDYAEKEPLMPFSLTPRWVFQHYSEITPDRLPYLPNASGQAVVMPYR